MLLVPVSLEWKPTDQVSRFAVVGSTAAALLLIAEVKRENFGLTLDLGHSLMAGENPAQSVAMATRAGKLFGVQVSKRALSTYIFPLFLPFHSNPPPPKMKSHTLSFSFL